MAKSNVTGICHICGDKGPLSFEHVPPRSAFNDRRVIYTTHDELFAQRCDGKPKGRVQQKGAGAYTLCPRCNNNTGSWYGVKFAEWCSQGMEILARANGNPSLFYLNYLYPLAVIKQIVVMFFSVNGPRFHRSNPELVRFVLNRDAKYLSPRYRFYVYYNTGVTLRSTGISVAMVQKNMQMYQLLSSEMSFPPFGYVMTWGDRPFDERLMEISHFARYDYDEQVVMEVRLPVLPTHTNFPGDYRTKAEILRDFAINTSSDRLGVDDVGQ